MRRKRDRTLGPAGALTVLLGLLAPVTGASASVYGGWVTRSNQELAPIVLTTEGARKALRGAVVSWSAPTCSFEGRTYEFHDAVRVVAAGARSRHLGSFETSRTAGGVFRARYSNTLAFASGQSALVTMTLTGTIGARTASGTLRAAAEIFDTPPSEPLPPNAPIAGFCTTSTLRWSAARHAGIVYGGRTSQDEPVVLRLSRTRARVAELGIGWLGRCRPGGGLFDNRDSFVGFPLDAHGAFGATFSTRFDAAVFDYDLHGHVSRTAASGTFKASVTEPDATTCPTGPTTWSAQTG